MLYNQKGMIEYARKIQAASQIKNNCIECSHGRIRHCRSSRLNARYDRIRR